MFERLRSLFRKKQVNILEQPLDRYVIRVNGEPVEVEALWPPRDIETSGIFTVTDYNYEENLAKGAAQMRASKVSRADQKRKNDSLMLSVREHIAEQVRPSEESPYFVNSRMPRLSQPYENG